MTDLPSGIVIGCIYHIPNISVRKRAKFRFSAIPGDAELSTTTICRAKRKIPPARQIAEMKDRRIHKISSGVPAASSKIAAAAAAGPPELQPDGRLWKISPTLRAESCFWKYNQARAPVEGLAAVRGVSDPGPASSEVVTARCSGTLRVVPTPPDGANPPKPF